MGPIASREPSQGALVRAIPPMFRCACGRGQGHRNTGHRNTRASRCYGRAASRRPAGPPAADQPAGPLSWANARWSAAGAPRCPGNGRTPGHAGTRALDLSALGILGSPGSARRRHDASSPCVTRLDVATRPCGHPGRALSPCVTRLDVATRPCGHPGRASPHVRRRRARATRAARPEEPEPAVPPRRVVRVTGANATGRTRCGSGAVSIDQSGSQTKSVPSK